MSEECEPKNVTGLDVLSGRLIGPERDVAKVFINMAANKL